MKKSVYTVVIIFLLSGFTFSLEAVDQSADEVVGELYKLVTFKAPNIPDWEKVKSLFVDDIVIVLRTGRNKTEKMGKERFVQLFIDDIKKHKLDKSGFYEKIVFKNIKEYRDIAYGTVIYEVGIPGSKRPPMQGVDVFLLAKKDNQWKIVSIINEAPVNKDPKIKQFIK